ncbi:hypothetical protein [Azospirillum thiophilum]|uniref:hypothetical protein n=1 Tax=Azospirillum thiophilum TaxID=528244 RepID=UPI0007617C76|nr:hypothetical protein [Azospirillum thiophilum]
MELRVLSQQAVLDGGFEGADAIVSIRGTASDISVADLDLACAQATLGDVDALLALLFDDIAIPVYGSFRGPTMDDVSAVIEFGRRIREQKPEGRVVVHCLHGVSWSAAMALTLIADDLGSGEEETVQRLLAQDVEGRMHPNPLIVSMANAALFRYGALDAALAAASSRYVKWRTFWREAATDPAGHWERSRKARFLRRTPE